MNNRDDYQYCQCDPYIPSPNNNRIAGNHYSIPRVGEICNPNHQEPMHTAGFITKQPVPHCHSCGKQRKQDSSRLSTNCYGRQYM